MSKIALKPSDTGSATFTLEAPATNTDRTLTLPDGDGTLLSDLSNVSASKITGNIDTSLLSGVFDASQMPAGSVIQVIQEVSNSFTRITGGGSSDVEPSVSITPSSANNKIMIFHSAGGMVQDSLASIGFALKRDGSVIWGCSRYGYISENDWVPIPFQISYLDSPDTTAEVTYTPFLDPENSGDIRHNDDDGDVLSGRNQAITIAMEIVG